MLALGFMLCTALISSIISNVPACALFLSIALEFLEPFTFRLPEKLLPEEIRVLWVINTMLILWLLSSWFSGSNIMLVALLGCCAFCMPRFGVLNITEFMRENSWDAFFLVGTVLSLL